MSAVHSTVLSQEAIGNRMLRHVCVDEATGCWEWTLTREKPPLLPYGRVYFGKKYRHAHRVMYEVKCGPIPEGMKVLHRCDNPPCCNPDHLFLGTTADNNADRDAKGRTAKGERNGRHTCPERTCRGDRHWARRSPEKRPRGEGHGRAKLTREVAQLIRAERDDGATLSALAKKYGVGTSTVFRVVTNQNWLE